MKKNSWVCNTRRRKFIRITEEELKLKLESILQLLQIGSASGLANSATPVQEAPIIERLQRRRKYV